MDPERLRALLEAVQSRSASIDDALRELRELPFRDLGFARVDTHRHLRTGFPEVVLGEGKTPEQIARIVAELRTAGERVLVTRTTRAVYDVLRKRQRREAAFHEAARIVTVGEATPHPDGRGT